MGDWTGRTGVGRAMLSFNPRSREGSDCEQHGHSRRFIAPKVCEGIQEDIVLCCINNGLDF